MQPAITVAALVRADERLREEFPRITLPVLIMHGTDDKATVCHGSEFFYETVGSKDKTLKLYEGHYHDLLNDVGKEGVMADITAWVHKRVPSQSERKVGRLSGFVGRVGDLAKHAVQQADALCQSGAVAGIRRGPT